MGWYGRPNPDGRKNKKHEAKKMTTWVNWMATNLNNQAKIGLTEILRRKLCLPLMC